MYLKYNVVQWVNSTIYLSKPYELHIVTGEEADLFPLFFKYAPFVYNFRLKSHILLFMISTSWKETELIIALKSSYEKFK